MGTKGRELWEKYKAEHSTDIFGQGTTSTGNTGRDLWNEYKRTVKIPANTQSAENATASGGAQAEKKSFLQRAGLTVSGGAKGSLAGNMDAMGVAYELGQSGRTKRYTEELREAQWAVARAKHDYDADPNNWQTKDALDTAITKMKGFADTLGKGAYEQALTAAYDAASKFDTGDLKALYNGLGVVDPEKGSGVQQQAASAARDLAYGVQESASKDLQEAKEGASKFGQMLVDAGASMTQMGIDSAVSGLMGFRPTKWNGGNKILQEALGIGEKIMTPGAMIPFATRAFGSSTMDARQDGADLEGQVLYGGAQAAKEVFTEKMFNIALPFAKAYGKGGLNSVVENGIRKAAEKLGKSDIGRVALERVLKFGASAASEGLEEFVGDFFEWQMPRIYGGDTDSFAETFSNALYDFAVGTISGAAGGAVEGGVDLYNDHAQARETKKNFGDQAQDIVNESKELAPDNKLAEKYQKKLDKGGKLTGFQLMRIMQQNENGIVEQDKQKIQTATEDRLKSMGETADVKRLAKVIAKRVAGEDISKAEHKLLYSESKYGRRLMTELNPDVSGRYDKESGEITDGISTDEWTGRLGTRLVNPITYNRSLGVTGAKYNPETGKLDAIVTDAEGKVETKPLQEAEPSPLQEELFDWSDSLKLKEAGPLMVNAYRQGQQNVELYARSFKLAYEYGKAGMPVDYVNKSEGVSYLNNMQRTMAYEAGQKAAQQAYENAGRSGGTASTATAKKPSVSLRGATVGGKTYAPVNRKTVDARQWASVKAMRAFSKVTGIDVVFYQSQANEKGEYEGANGFYKDGTLYLDINAGRDTVGMTETAVLKTAAHELTHFIQQNSRQYEELKRFVVERLAYEEGVNFEDLVMDKQRRESGLDYNEAVDEVVADACEMMLKDSTAAERLAKENRSLAQKIRDWLREWVKNLKAAIEGLQAERTESKAMMQYAQELQKIWDDALVDAARNGRGAQETENRAQASARKKYWRPDLAENEWRLLERRMGEEIGGRENFLDEATKWVYAEEKGVQVFALYGVGDGTEATPLYAVSGKQATEYNVAITEFVERSEKYDRDGRSADALSELLRRKKRSRGGNISQASRKARDAGTVLGLSGGSQRSDGGGTAGRGTENQRGVKEKFSMREPVEETRDLIALHNMTLDNLRGALKLGGLPMPSIAIVKASAGHSKYGPISVIFEKNTIDPQADRRNKVYGGDAYTPTAPQVEYPVRYEAMQRVEKYIAKLSEQVAGGIFRNDTALRRLGVDSESSMNTEVLADRLSRDDSVQAAYLADTGETLDPVRKLKEFSRYGNGALQQLVSEIGAQELARINAEIETGNYDAATDAEKAVKDIIRSAYEVKHRSFLDRKPELKQQRIEKYMENNVSRMTVEDFVRDAWEFYQDNGATTDEVDRWGTADKLHEAVNPADVKKWLLGQLDGVLGEAGIYNGKERYAPSGNERSFAQTHYAYTLENIVRAMSQTQQERGGQTFGVTAKSMQAVSTPSYGSIAEIKADSGRLGAVEGDAYDAAVEKVEKQIEQATRRVMRENKPHSDNQFEETQIIGEVMMEAAKGSKTEAAIRKVFQREGYSVSEETIGTMQAMFRAAAQLPTEYFEAKPQRAIRFDEAAAVVVPDNLPAELKRDLEKQGATVREYKAGDEQSRLEAVNADERVWFQQRELRLSDRDVLSLAADMALRQQNKNWTPEDRNRLEIFTVRLRRLEEAQAELEALKEERKVLLAGRKASELTKDERFKLSQNRNRTDLAKKNVEKREAQLYEIESIEAVKTLLRKSREVVEKETAFKARQRYREQRDENQKKAVERRKAKRSIMRLAERMNTNSDKKHIPEALKVPVGELLESLNLYSAAARKGTHISYNDNKYFEAMSDLKNVLEKQKAYEEGKPDGEDVLGGYPDLPVGFENMLAEHIGAVKKVMEKQPLKTDIVQAMDLDDLKNLNVILSVITTSVDKMNKMFINNQFGFVSDAAEDTGSSGTRIRKRPWSAAKPNARSCV